MINPVIKQQYFSVFQARSGGNDQLVYICLAKALRTFALGSISIVLVFFLLARGFSELSVGAILSATLLEDALLTPLVAAFAPRIGMRLILNLFSLLMMLSALVLAFSHWQWAIVAAAVFGIISPAGYEGGPFGAIEQTIISKIVPAELLAKALSYYHLSGFAGAAAGALVTGMLVSFFKTQHLPFIYEFVFSGYAVAAVLLLLIYKKLDSKRDLVRPAETNSSASSKDMQPKPRPTFKAVPKNVLKLASLQAIDAFGGGLVTQSFVAYWFYARYHTGAEFLGPLFFWGNVIAAVSFFIAPKFAKRFGLVNTMVFTHLPCSLALCLIPLMPSAALAGTVILLRCMFSSMDIPARQAFAMLVVTEKERPAAVALIDSARAIAQGAAPAICGSLMNNPITGFPFIFAGLCKSTYDVLLYACFRKVPLLPTHSIVIVETESSSSDTPEAVVTPQRELANIK